MSNSETDFLWRNSGLNARLGLGFTSIDARASFFILFLIFNVSWDSLQIFLAAVGFFWFLEFQGYNILVAIRKARSLIAGKHRYAQSPIAKRRRLIHG